MRLLLLLGGPLTMLSLVAACGGKVTHSPGQGGSGNSSGTSMDASSTTGDPSSASVSISSGPGSLCADFCAHRGVLMCPNSAGCLSNCEESLAGVCSAQYFALFQCDATLGTGCNFEPPCDDELAAIQECFDQQECTPALCSGTGSGGQSSCECTSTCGMTTYGASCEAIGSDGKCACFVNGILVGECEEQNPTCGLFDACCTQFF